MLREIGNRQLSTLMLPLVETMAGDEGAVCVFRSAADEEFSVTRPDISEEVEALIVAELREILRDEGVK
jgi:hypothetical protein